MFDEHTLIFVASKIEISYKVKKAGSLNPAPGPLMQNY
jgi:hypothetical protein